MPVSPKPPVEARVVAERLRALAMRESRYQVAAELLWRADVMDALGCKAT